jgi:hypothetical protein
MHMKRSSSSIRGEISKLQEQLRQAETREAERIGRLALKAGLGEVDIDETRLHAAFEEIAAHFRGVDHASSRTAASTGMHPSTSPLKTGADEGEIGEG